MAVYQRLRPARGRATSRRTSARRWSTARARRCGTCAVVARHPPRAPLDEPGADDAVLATYAAGRCSRRSRRLPRRQREVLALRHYLDLSEREIAETLGISQGAVKSHASRGSAALRQPPDPTARGDLVTVRPTPDPRLRPARPDRRRRVRRTPPRRSRRRPRPRPATPTRDRGWVPLTVAAAVATVLVIGGTAWLADRDQGARPCRGPSRPEPTADPRPRPATIAPGDDVAGRRSSTWRDAAPGARLFREQHTMRARAARRCRSPSTRRWPATPPTRTTTPSAGPPG